MHEDKILFVRLSYMGDMGFKDTFLLPGGGVERKESPEEAVRRECKEEVGINIQDVVDSGSFYTENEYKRDILYCFKARAPSPDFVIDNYEIVEARWFPMNALPPLTPITGRILKMAGII